ncbi:CDP-glycerol glycerophosphotransferase family protein [Sporolactobacillus terrae]|uniref:Glycosyl transferase family 1 domain-containing protein n=1 Tax=Sporolactobacillus terrae TaxID=269673 RepID=A0A5K7WTM9_9BACL|nr:CDP-glycerol glycerophosphotransferase family protein [Sporolactobacillus terrae]BBN97865.1 hypothetical protein St703_05700 [Sporolactobacillus terrae]
MIDKIKRAINLRKNRAYLFNYSHYYRTAKIKKNTILLESTHGRSFNGHLFYIAKELVEDYPQFTLYVVSKTPDETRIELSKQGLNRIRVVEHLSAVYCKLLASCEILINDTTFWPFFNKKKGQKYIITWHGTPLKTLGKDMEELVDVANVQRNFYMADYLITSNDYTQKILVDSHNLNGIYQGTLVEGPSPRNSILFNESIRSEVREKCNFKNKKVYLYMPTWRGEVGKVSNNNLKLLEDLQAISENLKSNELFFVKLHPFQSDINLEEFSNIQQIPNGYELYEFLTAIDTLITDYSSIMYDFMNTGREILIYAYDKEAYYQSRGAYEDINDYPFPLAHNIQELIKLLSGNELPNYASLRQRFCKFDNPDGTKILCDYLFNGQQNDNVIPSTIYNGKETVAILSGGFWDNGITTALLNTLENIDTSKRNYLLFCGKSKLKPQHYFRVRNLPEHVLFYPVPGQLNANLFERFINRLYTMREGFKGIPLLDQMIKAIYKKEAKRIFGDLKIDWFVHYTGFERKYAEMLRHIDAKKIIFVHTDMFKEYEIKKNFSKKIVVRAYKAADRIAIVNKFLVDDFVTKLPFARNKIRVMDNFLGEERVRKLSKQNLLETLVNVRIDFGSDNNSVDKRALHHQFDKLSPVLQDKLLIGLPDSIKDRMIEKVTNNLSSSEHLTYFGASETLFMEKYPYLFEQRAMIGEFVSNRFNGLYQHHDEALTADLSQSLRDQVPASIIRNVFDDSMLKLINLLVDPNVRVFINIGRFDHQKGHFRLIQAFDKMHAVYKNTVLIIVAPHGPLKSETISLAESVHSRNSIFILGRMSNPYTLLKHCDAFVLSSIYEGLGLVAYEALAAGTDLITVDLPPTIQHLKGREAMIVDNSQDGLYQGLVNYMQDDKVFRPFDFDVPKKQSVREFEELFHD